METCVLIPPEFSLVLTPDPAKVFEMGVSVWTTKSLNPGQNFYPDQGIVKIDKLDVYGLLQDDDVRIKFGCIDEIKTTENGKLRHCNWVRFLQPCSDLEKVNLVAVKVSGRSVFQVVKAVEANTQLLAYFDDEERGGMPIEIREALRESFGEEERCQSENEKNDEIDIEPISPASVDKTSDIASDDLNMDSDSEIIDVVDGDCSPAPTEQKSRTPELHQENPKYGMLGNQIPGFYPHNPHVAAYFQSMLMAQEAARMKQASPRSLSLGEIPKNSPNSSFRQSPSPGYQNPYLPPYFFGQPPAGSSSPNQNLHSPTSFPGKDGPMPQLVKPNTIHLNSGQNMMRFVPTPWGITSPDLAMRQTVISPISYNYPSPNKTLSPMAMGAKNVKMPADRIEEVAKSLEGAAGSEESHNTSKSSTSSVGKDTSTGSSPGKTPVKRNRERTWLPCEVCGKKFDRPSLLRRHMRTHTGEKPHACDVCGKAFSTSSSLNTHRRIHSGEKPHQCRVCGKRFTASSNLYYHRMTHNKEKPHKCTLCSKSFPTPGDLKSHMYVHNGSWPFRCDICDRGFSKQTNLKNHLLLHSGDKPHECQLCGKRFALQCNLRTHQKTHEGEPQEECFKCGKLFLSQLQRLVNGYCKNCLNSSIGGANAGAKKSGQKQESAKPFKSITDFLKPDSETKNPNATADIRHVLPTSFRYPLHLAPSSDVQSYANALLPSRVPPMAHSGAPMVPHDLSASYAAHFRQFTQIPSAVPISGEVYPHRPIGISAKTLQNMVNSGNGMVHYGPGTSWPRVVGSPF